MLSDAQKSYPVCDVTVIPMNSENSPLHQDVITRDGRMPQTGKADKAVPAKDWIVIDGKVKFLVPRTKWGLSLTSLFEPGKYPGGGIKNGIVRIYL